MKTINIIKRYKEIVVTYNRVRLVDIWHMIKINFIYSSLYYLTLYLENCPTYSNKSWKISGGGYLFLIHNK